jgi:hypothetical protein
MSHATNEFVLGFAELGAGVRSATNITGKTLSGFERHYMARFLTTLSYIISTELKDENKLRFLTMKIKYMPGHVRVSEVILGGTNPLTEVGLKNAAKVNVDSPMSPILPFDPYRDAFRKLTALSTSQLLAQISKDLTFLNDELIAKILIGETPSVAATILQFLPPDRVKEVKALIPVNFCEFVEKTMVDIKGFLPSQIFLPKFSSDRRLSRRYETNITLKDGCHHIMPFSY